MDLVPRVTRSSQCHIYSMIHCLHSEYVFTINEINTPDECRVGNNEERKILEKYVLIYRYLHGPDDDHFVHALASHHSYHLHIRAN